MSVFTLMVFTDGFGGLLKTRKHTQVVNLLPAAYVVGRVVTAIGDR